ncbi:hypothetical protein R3P38DRAFT_2788019 [Favolaschia claudopus]|uniref:Uncharacterized protein n=1 Tax=Favolaschia claudopus TaxID=2862362 RepID=A0AAW0AL04_9AGAR
MSQDFRRGRSSALFVYVQQPLGKPIRARRTYAFGNLLLARSSFLLSSEKIDRVYRGEMRPAEQRAYIDAMYDFPLAAKDASLHRQMFELFDAPLTPIAADSDDDDMPPSPQPLAFPLSNIRDHPAPTSDNADDHYPPAPNSDAENGELIPTSPTPAAVFGAIRSALASDGLFYTPDGYFAADGRYADPLNGDAHVHVSPVSSTIDLEELLPSPLPSPSPSNNRLLSPSASETGTVDSLFESDTEIDELMSSPSIATANFDPPSPTSSPSIAVADVDPPSPIDSIFESDSELEQFMDSPTGGLGYPDESDSHFEPDIDFDQLMGSATGGLGYPADNLDESDDEFDELMSSPPTAAADIDTASSARLDSPTDSLFASDVDLASPARSETSLALEQLLSTPITPNSDTSMELDELLSSPATPNATPDTSMEIEDPFSPLRTPSSGHALDPSSSLFTLGSPFELAPRSGSSIELEPDYPFPPPKLPSLDFFRIDRGYSTPDFGQLDSSPTPPRRLITYLKRDRERYGRRAVIDPQPMTEDVDPQLQDGPEPSTSTASAPPNNQSGGDAHRRVKRRVDAKPEPSRISRRLSRQSVNNSASAVRTAAWYTHYEAYSAVEGFPRPLIDCNGVVMVVIAAPPRALESWWEWVIAHATTHSLNLYRYTDFSLFGKEESVAYFGLLFGPDGPFEVTFSGPAGEALAQILKSVCFRAISAYQNHLYRLYAPRSYAYLAAKIDQLDLTLPFRNSIFTTCELRYGDVPTFEDFNDAAAFDTMEAMTVVGSTGGHITFEEDQIIHELNVGNTVLAASGAKKTNFPTIGKTGRRFVFRQYVSAGVLRWIEKGGRTDKEFETAPEAERAAWVAGRRDRANTGLKMFGRLSDPIA